MPTLRKTTSELRSSKTIKSNKERPKTKAKQLNMKNMETSDILAMIKKN